MLTNIAGDIHGLPIMTKQKAGRVYFRLMVFVVSKTAIFYAVKIFKFAIVIKTFVNFRIQKSKYSHFTGCILSETCDGHFTNGFILIFEQSLGMIVRNQQLKFSHMNNVTMSKIATIAYAVVIIVFGITHFINTQEMRNLVPAFVPGGGVWVYITGAFLVASGAAILLNQKARLAAILLTVLLLCFALFTHLPRLINGFDSGLGLIMKDIGLAAGSLLIASRSEA